MPAVPYWRLSGLYFSYFVMVGAMSPYWGLYLESLGFVAWEIGLLTSIPFLTKLVAPNLWSWISDKYRLRTLVIRVGLAFALLFFSLVSLTDNFVSLSILLLLFGVFSNAILPQVEALTLTYLGDRVHTYSRVRLWGSLGFIVAVLILGVVFEYIAITWLPLAVIAALFSSLCVALYLPPVAIRYGKDEKHNFFALLLNKYVIVFYTVMFFLQFSHGAYYAFFSIYLESLNYSKTLIGALWATAIVCEILIFFKIPEIFSRYSKSALLSLSLLMTILRWVLIAWGAGNIYLCLAAQVLHAFSFGMIHALAIDYIKSTFGEAVQGQAQAFYSAVSFGAGASLGMLAAGFFWDFSPQLVFVGSAIAALIGWMLALMFLRNDK